MLLGGASAAPSASCSAFPACASSGFYLAVATLAAQFFMRLGLPAHRLVHQQQSSGVITAQKLEMLGYAFDTPTEKYLFCLAS
jgi:branched-chain amino acid transport system permease protein